MTARIVIVPGAMPSRDANGRALAAKFRFYLPTSGGVPTTVYTDNTLTVPHDFPILSDSAGRWPAIWADDALSFDVGWTDQVFDQVIKTFTGITPAADAVLASADIAAAAATAAQTAQTAAELAEAQAQAAADSISGEPFTATSLTSLSIGAGTKVWVLQEDHVLFHEGQTVVGAVTAPLASNQMTGVVQSYDTVTKTLTVLVGSHAEPSGVGPYATWRLSLSASAGVPVNRQVLAAGLATGGGDLSADRTITVPAAVAADVRTGTDATKAATSAALAGSAAFVALTDAATVAWDTNSGPNAKVTLGGNRTIGAPTNLKDGWPYVLDISQDATGSRVPSWNAIWDFGLTGAPTLSTGANKKDKVTAQYSAASGKLEVIGVRKSA